MQVLNLGQRVFKVSAGELKPQEVIDLPKEEAKHLKAMFKGEIKLIEEVKKEEPKEPKKSKKQK